MKFFYLAFLFISIASCQSSGESKTIVTEEKIETYDLLKKYPEIEIDTGIFENGTYTNNELKFSINLPESWIYCSHDSIIQRTKEFNEVRPFHEQLHLDLSKKRALFETFENESIIHEGSIRATIGLSVHSKYSFLEDQGEEVHQTAQDFINAIEDLHSTVQTHHEMEKWFSLEDEEKKEEVLGGKTFKTSVQYDDETDSEFKYHILKVDDLFLMLFIAYPSGEPTQEQIDALNSIQFF
jgi:hypothetical protein